LDFAGQTDRFYGKENDWGYLGFGPYIGRSCLYGHDLALQLLAKATGAGSQAQTHHRKLSQPVYYEEEYDLRLERHLRVSRTKVFINNGLLFLVFSLESIKASMMRWASSAGGFPNYW